MKHPIKWESLAKWKYRLTADLAMQTRIKGIECKTEYIRLHEDGRIVMFKGYAWNGASGPTLDTDDTMAPSAGHDALYQLIEMGAIPSSLRVEADRDLRDWLIGEGMPEVRALLWYRAVRLAGGMYA